MGHQGWRRPSSCRRKPSRAWLCIYCSFHRYWLPLHLTVSLSWQKSWCNFPSLEQHENGLKAQRNRRFVNALWKLQFVLKGSVCVRVRIHMHMASLCVNVRGGPRGKGRYRGLGRAGVVCVASTVCPSAVTVWCDVRSQTVLTPRITLKTHAPSPLANLRSHAQSRGEQRRRDSVPALKPSV